MADAIRNADWSSSTLGPISGWDPGLTAALDTILEARFPMFIAWGEALTFFYNDAYEPVLLGKTACLGAPMRTIFPEAWTRLGPLIAQAAVGQASYCEDFEVPLVRHARLSSTWWSFSHSPLRTGEGSI
ncbi:MAG: LuxR family transcriptional regulator, partial [Brevundimonas sp.]